VIPPSTPIDEATKALALTVFLPSYIRTAGDLLVALDRKEVEVDAKTAKRIRESVG